MIFNFRWWSLQIQFWDDWLPLSLPHLWHVSVLSHEVSRSFAWMSDLEHRIWRLNPILAFLAKIVIWSDSTLVSNSNDWISTAPITDKLRVDNFSLIVSFFLKMLDQKFLVLRGAALSHFVAQDLLQILKEPVVQSSSSIAFFARKALFVYHFAITLEAFWKLFNILEWLLSGIQTIVLWLDDQALDILLLTNVVLLASLRFDHDFSATLNISLQSLSLRGALLGVDHSPDLLVLSVGCVRVEAFAVGEGLLLH